MYRSVRLDPELLVSVSGRFDGSIAPSIYEDVVHAVDGDIELVTIDLHEVAVYDDSAVSVLCAIASGAAARRARVVCCLAGREPFEATDPTVMRRELTLTWGGPPRS